MRRFALACLTAATLAAGIMSTPQRAEAFGFDRCYTPGCDPYFYYPTDRGYYPYYNSGQWRTAREMRYRKRIARRHFYYPQYNPAWGHPVYLYDNRAFHGRHGGHHIGHW
jgi:hypothetical protein